MVSATLSLQNKVLLTLVLHFRDCS